MRNRIEIMKLIERSEFEKAVKTIELYVLQQEKILLQAKGLFKISKSLLADKKTKLFNLDMTVRLHSCLIANDVDLDITVSDFTEKYNQKRLLKFRNFGKRNHQEIKKLINNSGIYWG